MGPLALETVNRTSHLQKERQFDVTRWVDVALALGGIIMLSPVLVGLALVVKLHDGGPVFHRSVRVGRGEYPFILYKFRTMVVDAETAGPGITSRGDARVTRLGHFLRRRKLDELPQLINILRGEMAVVGPRPEDPRYVAYYSPEERRLLRVRPGLTSAASVHYKNEENLLAGPNWEAVYRDEILPHKLAIELHYLQRRTLWTDLVIVFRSVITMIR